MLGYDVSIVVVNGLVLVVIFGVYDVVSVIVDWLCG